MKEIKIISANTHTSEYMLHKYWSRKPYNILNHFLNHLVDEGGVVIDPFCGSGVLLSEAKKLNINGYGFDVNPVAALISEVTCNPPSPKEFEDIMIPILEKVKNKFEKTFITKNGQLIKYNVHEIVIKCSNCGKKVRASEAEKRGRIYKCNHCMNRLNFNLSNLVETKIQKIVLEKSIKVNSENEINIQEEFSNKVNYESYKQTNFTFTENKRILAYKGMETKRLFTNRNFAIINYLNDLVEKIENDDLRNTAQMFVTASVAQCSRLIPYRNNMTTGGAAWSVPGFWVPPLHVETNPIVHFYARLKKFEKGLKELRNNQKTSTIKIENTDAISGLKKLFKDNVKADLIFLDPPYGDSVPYTEFSKLWNSFLSIDVDHGTDLSVSDRLSKEESWFNYNLMLNGIMKNLTNCLKDDGNLLITFNNNDLKAWEALFSSLQNNKLTCKYVTYQIPAVISAKAQFSIEGSYISDIYAIYTKDNNLTPIRDLNPVIDEITKVANFREGILSKNLLLRTISIAWMKNNISVELLKEIDGLIKSLFDTEDNKSFILKNIDSQSPRMKTEVKKIASKFLKHGPCSWSALYEYIVNEIADFGIPEPAEIMQILENDMIYDNKKKRCYAYQENLFSYMNND